MRIDVFKNFATPSECQTLAKWALDHQDTILGTPTLKVGAWQQRRTSRHAEGDYSLPAVAYEIQHRIHSLFLKSPPHAPNGGKDGIIVISTAPGGESPEHIDPQPLPGVDVLRANIIVQAAEAGGELFVEGKEVNIGAGDLHFYNVSRHIHGVRPVRGNQTRIIWLFGFCINGDDWESGRIALYPRGDSIY